MFLPSVTDLTHAEIERRRQIWLGKRPVIDSSSGTASFYSLFFLREDVIFFLSTQPSPALFLGDPPRPYGGRAQDEFTTAGAPFI
jgi:hypothetical protein